MDQAILLDTNVLSELMRLQPDVRVLAWFGVNTNAGFYISAVTQAEILLGISLLPAGKRRSRLADAAAEMFSEEFSGQSLSFDAQSAKIYAELVAARTHAGQPISTEDAQIAAITLSNHLCLATRNVKDFTGIAGLILINPWEAWT
jgi:predicted nucleic acid-binding protein